jgi:hypothetical protein
MPVPHFGAGICMKAANTRPYHSITISGKLLREHTFKAIFLNKLARVSRVFTSLCARRYYRGKVCHLSTLKSVNLVAECPDISRIEAERMNLAPG